jgi:uncharacterized membrane protein
LRDITLSLLHIEFLILFFIFCFLLLRDIRKKYDGVAVGMLIFFFTYGFLGQAWNIFLTASRVYEIDVQPYLLDLRIIQLLLANVGLLILVRNYRRYEKEGNGTYN